MHAFPDPPRAHAQKEPAKPGGGGDELDDLLDDLDCVNSPPAVSTRREISKNSTAQEGSRIAQTGSSRKCFPVCLAGRYVVYTPLSAATLTLFGGAVPTLTTEGCFLAMQGCFLPDHRWMHSAATSTVSLTKKDAFFADYRWRLCPIT